MMTGLEQLKVWIIKYQEVNGNPPIEEIKMQIDLLDAEERERCNIDLVSKLFLFKVKDYTTELIGRYNEDKDCYYVQRGDGSKYEYDSDRIVWKRELNVC